MAKKEEKQTQQEQDKDYIAKHHKLYTHATQLSDTASHTHTEAYTAAVSKHLMKDGVVDFEKLDNDAVQKQFVKTMSDLYVSRAKEHFKMSKDLNEVEEDLLMQTYVGVTQGLLKEQVNRYGKRFTHAQFDQIKHQIQQQLSKRMYASAGQHLDQANVGGIIKHVGLESKLDSGKVTVDEARELLETFHREGSIPDTALREHVAQYKIKKKDTKKAA